MKEKIIHQLDAFFRPQSIAVIGAKDTLNSVGRTVMVNLTSSGFEGKVIPINPHRNEVLGIPCFKSVVEVLSPVDLAVIVVPASHVLEVMHTCVEAKVKAVIIISAGFGESGEEGRILENEVIDLAKKNSIRVIGPNCLGIMNPALGLNATFARGLARTGTLAFISQSGALCTAVLDWSAKEEIGFSSFVSVGSMSDVGWGDLIEYFGDDAGTRSILMYMESVHDPRSFLSAAKEVSWRKPIIVIKPGRSKEGAHAAASHTGSLVGSDVVFDAACERAGILRVDTVSQLFDMAEVLARQPRPAGKRLAIVTNAGGPAVLATDALVAREGAMAVFSEGTISYLDSVLPREWSRGNPVDILGDASPARFKEALGAVIKDPGTDGALVILTPQDMTDPSTTAQAICEFAKLQKKPILTSWMGGDTVEEGKRILATFGIPSFSYPDAAARTFATMWKQARMLHDLFLPPRQKLEKSLEERRERREKAKVIFQKKRILSEYSSKLLLALYGFSVVLPEYADTEEEACVLAKSIGYPVVLKIEDERIIHKAESNGVFLRLNDDVALKNAFRTLRSDFKERFGEGERVKISVQKMIEEEGIELIVGSKRDEQFGQVILFGAGGINVEIFGDIALSLPPLTSTSARRMIERTKIARALTSFKKKEAIPLIVIEDFLILFSDMILENPEIYECDINPLLVTSSGLFCLDARIILEENNVVPNAVCPYEQEYVRDVHVEKEKVLRIRPIKPEDALAMKYFHERLTNAPLYHDIFAFLPFDKLPLDTLMHLCHMERRIVLVIECLTEKQVVGIAAMRRGDVKVDLFLAFESDERIGELLLSNMREIGKKEGVEKIQISVKPTNHPLMNLLSSHGFVEIAKNKEKIIFESNH